MSKRVSIRYSAVGSRLLALAMGVGFTGASSGLYGCGMSWSEPRSYFDAVDYQGTVSLVKTLGELKGARDSKIPIFAIFNSRDNGSSPYLGAQWKLPLLESRIVQMDENTFRIDQPDGWYRLLGREPKNPNLLSGQGGWKAQIQGDTITAWADCGTKLVFNSGKLTAMQLEKQNLSYVYSNGIVSQIKDDGKVVFETIIGKNPAEIVGFRVNGEEIKIALAQKPHIERLSGVNFVSKMEKSLSMIESRGASQNFEYFTDEILNPVIDLGDRKITWDPISAKIIKDGDWQYEIKPGPGIYDSASIARVNPEGRRESWFRDSSRGKETIENADGTRKVTSWFTSGKLNGKLRKIVESREGIDATLAEFSYDEDGRPIRQFARDKVPVRYSYKNGQDSASNEGLQIRQSENDKSASAVLNGMPIFSVVWKDGLINLSYEK